MMNFHQLWWGWFMLPNHLKGILYKVCVSPWHFRTHSLILCSHPPGAFSGASCCFLLRKALWQQIRRFCWDGGTDTSLSSFLHANKSGQLLDLISRIFLSYTLVLISSVVLFSPAFPSASFPSLYVSVQASTEFMFIYSTVVFLLYI